MTKDDLEALSVGDVIEFDVPYRGEVVEVFESGLSSYHLTGLKASDTPSERKGVTMVRIKLKGGGIMTIGPGSCEGFRLVEKASTEPPPNHKKRAICSKENHLCPQGG